MSFLVDTDTCSAQLKGDGRVGNRFLQYTGRLYVSAITVAELYSWVLRRGSPATRRQGLAHLLAATVVLSVGEDIAVRCGEIRGDA